MAYSDNEYSFFFISNKNWEPKWQLHNARGHVAIGLGNTVADRAKLLPYHISVLELTSDISNWPVIDKSATHEKMRNLLAKVRETDCTVSVFTDSMFGSSAVEQIQQTKEAADPQILAIGLFGATETLRQLTKNLSLATF